jgi:putative ABC transport system permease protein
LGASPGKVQILVFRQGFATVNLGLTIGIGLTAVLLRVHRFTPGLDSPDITTFVIATTLVSVAAATACCIPARRAAKVDPMVALRRE